jgi:hypothetical protein
VLGRGEDLGPVPGQGHHGAVGVAHSDVSGAVMNPEMYAYRVKNTGEVSPVYLQLLLRTNSSRELLEGMITGTSNRTRLESAEQLLGLPIPPLPTLDEQEQIAAIFVQSVDATKAAEDLRRSAETAAAQVWDNPAVTGHGLVESESLCGKQV